MPRRRRNGTLLAQEEVLLSKERTILSFMRTALTFIGVGVVIVNFLKDFVFQVVGYGLIAIGFVEVAESMRRLREKQKVVKRLSRQTKI